MARPSLNQIASAETPSWRTAPRLLAPSYGRLQGAAQRGPVAVAHREALGRGGDIGDADERHLDVAGALEVGVEQRELAIELPARARARRVPDDLHAARQGPRRDPLDGRQIDREEGVAVALFRR